MKEALVTWTGGMSFDGRTGSGHNVVMDAREDVGGENKGPRPTELLLTALGGCTGMDIVSILKKQRLEVDRFEVAMEGHERAEHPKHYEKITMVYRLWGKDIPEEKYRRAVELSFTTYCSVGALLKKGAEVAYRLELNGTPLD